MIGGDLSSASSNKTTEEKEQVMGIYFILRSDGGQYKKLLDNLKDSANRGCNEYPTMLTNAFDLLVRESGEYDTIKPKILWTWWLWRL